MGDTQAAIHALTHAVSEGGSAAFEILPATPAEICLLPPSLFDFRRNSYHARIQFSVHCHSVIEFIHYTNSMHSVTDHRE